ncbi:MAG: DinB family protein [Hymenobacteraceae bacterium]|nr:DinB family protein [Hymenobacteraceae bacterium]
MESAAYSHIQLMHPKLEMKYLRLEKTRNRLLDELEGYDDTLLNTSPAEGKWSVNQIVAHLVLVEKLTMGYMQHKLQKQEALPPSSFSSWISSVLLKLALMSGKKFKAPAPVATVPDRASLPALRREWNEIRYKMEDVLTELPPQVLDKCLFKHPYAGPLSVSQTLDFIQDHFDHHLRQIQQLKGSLVK